ncbi:Histidine phosphatase superfamily (branch 1) [Stigmatella aurantiaca]|uniref:Histidine phosphatase superfamily (Branch 1) n=1 Tax=Stigmatella aurantiaca TaxID=41 RepID=A0A1H7Q660_STIAU|nr:phosphoglycerate mutase family protein [Stigmatella aurantiaca]SEL43472.1 Histidine phosphatase superfamily (branch 1) [Stigmatella aurantiaca]
MKTILIFNLDAPKTRSGLFLSALLGGLLPWLLLGCATPRGEPRPLRETTVWVVRHAEKTSAEAKDPPLSEQGQVRAEDLARRLKGEGVEVFLVSPTLRTQATAEPLARASGKELLSYAAKDYAGLRERILKEFRGKTVLVVGHSNTVLEILEALGAPRPLPALADEDYDYLFRVSLPEAGAATVKTVQYGAAHRQ